VAVGLLAYYLYDRNRKMKLVSDLKAGANTDADNTKESDCRKEWVEKIGSKSRFISEEGAKASEDNYVKSCLKNK
jgi:hypothetical protein